MGSILALWLGLSAAGWPAGPSAAPSPSDAAGLERTLENGMSVALGHSFILNRGDEDRANAPDYVGAWTAELKVPVLVAELVAKVAFGLGGDQDYRDGIRILPGLGWAYGVGIDIPLGDGPTLGLTFLHTVDGGHTFDVAVAVGWTFL